ncbi:hypothetical protein ABZP36_002718 [Zizania latifolia]
MDKATDYEFYDFDLDSSRFKSPFDRRPLVGPRPRRRKNAAKRTLRLVGSSDPDYVRQCGLLTATHSEITRPFSLHAVDGHVLIVRVAWHAPRLVDLQRRQTATAVVDLVLVNRCLGSPVTRGKGHGGRVVSIDLTDPAWAETTREEARCVEL